MPLLKTKALNSFDELSLEIDPDVGGLIWLSTSSFRELPHPFEWLDYLFNLTLSKSLNGHKTPEETNSDYFFSRSFDKNLALFFLEKQNVENKLGDIQNFLAFIESSPTFGKKIKLICDEQGFLPQKIAEKLDIQLVTKS